MSRVVHSYERSVRVVTGDTDRRQDDGSVGLYGRESGWWDW